MKNVKRSRSKSFGPIIVSKTDLKHFWELLERQAATDARSLEEAKRLNPQQHFPNPKRPEISIVSSGQISTEADDSAVLDNDVLDTLKTESVLLTYSTYSPISKSIRIRFEEDDSIISSGRASYSVSGNDVAWVDATFAEMERIAAAVRPQSTWFRNWRLPIVIILSLAIGFVFSKFLILFTDTSNTPDPRWLVLAKAHPPLLSAIGIGLFFLIGYFPALGLTNWAGRIWPEVEFDFGPEHMKGKKRQRARIGALVGLVILPLLIEAFNRYGLGWR